ncbi:MAG: hypothetical protein LBM67_03875 [Lentimicrobiaceae bacterium]|jgi:hypothetical protein|nr:hypothetical protein [Lentimicrobiaceae bacterium]
MKKITFTFLMFVSFFAVQQLHAQTEFISGALPLTEAEAAQIPVLQLSPQSAASPLPDSAHNNWRIYFPPIYDQQRTGSCAQASTIGYTFTYEMNRLRNVAS